MNPNRFSSSTIANLSKRASNTCSNPYCRIPTSGPHSDNEKAVNIGVAAHIRGANSGSARYDAAMLPTARSSISNGIWLCQSCSKLIDNDEARFTVEMLNRWKMRHEEDILEQLGYSFGEKELRDDIKRIMKQESSSALQIAIDRPDYWQFLLLSELWNGVFERTRLKCSEIRRGVAYKPLHHVLTSSDVLHWTKSVSKDLVNILHLFASIMQFTVDGKEDFSIEVLRRYVRTRQHIEDGCNALVEWDLNVLFTSFPSALDDLSQRYLNITESILADLEPLTIKMTSLAVEKATGEHSIVVKPSLPSEVIEYLSSIVTRASEVYRNHGS